MGRKFNMRKVLYATYDIFLYVALLIAALLIVPVVLALLTLLYTLYVLLVHAPGVVCGEMFGRVRRWFALDTREEYDLLW